MKISCAAYAYAAAARWRYEAVLLNCATLCDLLNHPENPGAHSAHVLFARFLADGLAALADGHGDAPVRTAGKFFCGNVSERDSGKKNKPRGAGS
jgi:hypothetical protein